MDSIISSQGCLSRICTKAASFMWTSPSKEPGTWRLLRSSFRRVFAGLVASALISSPALADTFPGKPVRIIIGVSVGGLADNMTRMMAAELQERWGQPVIVESKPGASGAIAAGAVARSPADGYTLAMVISTYATNPSLKKDLGYDPKFPMVPVTMLARAPTVLLTGAKSDIHVFGDLVAKAKADPNSYAYGSAGAGGMTHLVGELVNESVGLKLLHVPYKGGAPALNDLLGGQIPLQFSTISTIYQHYKGGTVRALAIAAAERDVSMPEVPTFKELGYPDVIVEEWYALVAPYGTPDSVVKAISKEVTDVLKMPAIREKLVGLNLGGTSPSETQAFIDGEMARWGKFIEVNDIKTQ
ncbi:tripartite tricarboxylate transporter substrate binding protein [Bordetella sp. BOR01]|uniref:Bug family tripartite tricarboxylate transporter substrate binding protein n=1 Tax=Bordetella sp. BOR01 TaxID=2854779 RepID=UPI001C45D1B8|nr:tripartite tricarboxylate transporter substrate-binding protein [Bordetella sp. BOR01]MBV7483292.1 tripartite tricarboxylate transporter substrate binding protein [Bordetella sp. BOR01]